MDDLLRATACRMQLTEPEEVAAFAIKGIRAGRFWLIPESETGDRMFQKAREQQHLGARKIRRTSFRRLMRKRVALVCVIFAPICAA